jgi:hypothetical protein
LPPDLTVLIFALLIYVLFDFGLRYVLTYRFTDENVRAVLFGVVALSVRRCQSITEVHTTSFFEGQFTWVWRVTNRLTGHGVLIFREGSLF